MKPVIYNESQLDDLVARIRRQTAVDGSYSLDDDACESSRLDTGAPNRTACYKRGVRLCDMQRVGGAALSIAANSPTGVIQVIPVNTPFFEPVAAECIVTETNNPNANRRIRFTAFAIGGSPQEPIDDRAPTAATVAFIWSDHFLPADFGPRPVQWGVFSNVANTKPLQIFGFNPNAVLVDVEWVVYGNSIQTLPDGIKLGERIPDHMNPYLHAA